MLSTRRADMNNTWKPLHTLLALVIVPLLTILVGRFLASTIWAWIIIAVLLGGLLVASGHGITGLARGLFIDERNAISLSRLQTAVWTVIIVSGFVTAALANVRLGESMPLDISLPGELWALLGISATSLVGTPLIRTGKVRRRPDVDNFTTTLNDLGFAVERAEVDDADVRRLSVTSEARTRLMAEDADEAARPPAEPPPQSDGIVLRRLRPEYSKWSDLFSGEDTGNGAHLDLGKVQMFYFTLAIVVAYAVAMANMFVDMGDHGISEFPALTGGIVALLGISHAAYLANKAVDRP
jgi:hypothetical protein